jgi:hypothetical protein
MTLRSRPRSAAAILAAVTAGDDVVEARRGVDRVLGGDGDDVLHLGPNPLLEGPTGDVALAGAGDDVVVGGRGFDVLSGGPGDDTVSSGRGAGVLEDRQGDDVLLGGPSGDVAYVGPGRDRIRSAPAPSSSARTARPTWSCAVAVPTPCTTAGRPRISTASLTVRRSWPRPDGSLLCPFRGTRRGSVSRHAMTFRHVHHAMAMSSRHRMFSSLSLNQAAWPISAMAATSPSQVTPGMS